MDIPENLKRLLWEFDFDNIDFSDGVPNAVCERVMAHGCWNEMQWLIQVAGPERLRTFLKGRGAKVLNPREVAFWSLVCSVPEGQASVWISAARARQAAWCG